MVIESHKFLIFADYSAEGSRKRKEFQLICAELYKRSIRFTLAYPAILRLQAPDGEQLTFQSLEKANTFLRALPPRQVTPNTYADKVKHGSRDQRSPRKDPPKLLKPTSLLDQPEYR